MSGSAAAAVYICLQLSNAAREVTKSLGKKGYPSELDGSRRPRRNTISPNYINNTYRDKCAQVHRIKNKTGNVAPAVMCSVLEGKMDLNNKYVCCPSLFKFRS